MLLSFSANAQNTCEVYGSDGATATVLKKGGQAGANGTLFVPVSVQNYKKNSGEGRSVEVWIEVRDQNTRCVVKRECANVWIEQHYYSGEGKAKVEGLEPNHDYLYNIDSAKTCM